MSSMFSSTSRVLLTSALCLATAGCQVSTSGLLNKARGGGSSSGGSSSGGSSSDDSSGSSSDSSGSSSDDRPPSTSDAFEVPYVPPGPGLAAVGAYKAPWCTKAEPEARLPPSGLARSITSSDPFSNTELTVSGLCSLPDDSRFQKMVGAYIQLYVNDTGATPAQIATYLALHRHEDNYKDLNTETCKKFKVSGEASGRDKALTIMSGAVVGCDSMAQNGDPLWMASSSFKLDFNLHGLWHLDREATLPSQLVGIYHVMSCVAGGKPDDTWALVRYAGCRADVKQLDEKKLLAELKADGHNEQATAVAVLALSKAKYRASLFEKALQAKAAEDPEIKELFIDAPDKAWKDWVAARKEHKAAVDAAHAYEDRFNGPRKSAAKGCLKEAQANLDAYTASHSGKTRDELIDAVADPIGVILLEHVRSCNEMEGRERIAGVWELLIKWGKPARGPRFAARVAMASVVARIVSDRPKFFITPDMLSLGSLTAPVQMGYGRHDQPTIEKEGIVAKVDRKGDKVYVTFRTDKWTEDEQDCHYGTRIVMFATDGTPIYEWLCKRTGRKMTRSETVDPFYTTPELARGIAPGTFVRYGSGIERDDAGTFMGTPYEVWKNGDRKQLVSIFGIAAR